MQAHNRAIADWYGKIERGEIKLPRFQRHEAWDRKRICSLMNTGTQNLPLGITLTLEVGEKEPFVSRYLKTAPDTGGRVYAQLLDGQQRLTALYRMFQNNYEDETYYLHFPDLDEHNDWEFENFQTFYYSRYWKKGQRYPLWCHKPEAVLSRGLIPTHLFKPVDNTGEVEQWLADAHPSPDFTSADANEVKAYYEKQQLLKSRIQDIRAVIHNYNLPYLALPSSTPKDVALNVFINMNTNSKALSTYDIIVAEIEGVKGESLHDLQEELLVEFPAIEHYGDTEQLILNTSALLQDKLPNRRGQWDMDKKVLVDNWERMAQGLGYMCTFLQDQGIPDKQRLPTNAVLAVIAALNSYMAEKGDQRGLHEQYLKKYLWYAFFTNRYENSAASSAFYDFRAIRNTLQGAQKPLSPGNSRPFELKDAPIFNSTEYEFASVEELLTAKWPKGETIRGKGIMAVACKLGSHDFATGQPLIQNLGDRHYHHIFPDALLKEAGIENSFIALNSALVTNTTNLNIGRKEPLTYLKERYKWTSEAIVNERLYSHAIPVAELANGGYEGLSDEEKQEKVREDYQAFIKKRAELIRATALKLAEGRAVALTELAQMESHA